MASEIGKIVHCKICGAPIEARGNRLYCPVCYNQNRRNAAQRSNARTKMEREQTKREEAKMKENNRIATSAAELNMRAKLSNLGGISYGDLSIWEQTHGMEFSAWVLLPPVWVCRTPSLPAMQALRCTTSLAT